MEQVVRERWRMEDGIEGDRVTEDRRWTSDGGQRMECQRLLVME